MPEVNYPMRPAAQEPGTKHNIGTILENWCKKYGVFIRVILQVRILNNDQLARRYLETRAQSCSFAKIALLQYDLIDPSMRFRLKKFSRSIGRSIIHDDDFNVLDRRRTDSIYHSFDRRSLVVTRDNDRELHLSPFTKQNASVNVRGEASFVNVMITALMLDFSLRFQL